MVTMSTDPGLSGAVVLLGPGVFQCRRDFKHWEDIAAAITEFSPLADVAVVELVHSMPGQGVASMFAFGKSAGVALGAFKANGFSLQRGKPLIEVPPQRWQGFFWDLMGAPKGKGMRLNFDSKAVVKKFYPAAADVILREKDHNTADAILIGLWKQMNPGVTTSIREKEAKVLAKRAKSS